MASSWLRAYLAPVLLWSRAFVARGLPEGKAPPDREDEMHESMGTITMRRSDEQQQWCRPQHARPKVRSSRNPQWPPLRS